MTEGGREGCIEDKWNEGGIECFKLMFSQMCILIIIKYLSIGF